MLDVNGDQSRIRIIEIPSITIHVDITYPVLQLILLVYLGNWPYIQGR